MISWIFITDSPYQKGGTGRTFSLFVPLFIFLIGMLVSLRHNFFGLVERVLVALFSSFLIGVTVAVLVMPRLVALLYDDKIWYLWQTKHRILINLLCYGLILLFLWLLIDFYFRIRIKFSE